MALKSYHKETLNDNWFEERAKPLNGVLPHDGVKEFSTTSSTEFVGAEPAVVRSKPRMVGERNIGQALLQSAGSDISQGFRSKLPRPDLDKERRYLETTQRTAYGTPISTNQRRESARDALGAAGGPGGQQVERGKEVSGVMGEVYKTSIEPQRDTASQRAWLYSTDPMITAVQKRAELISTKAAAGMTKSEPSHFRRQSTSITTVPSKHTVFVDD